MAEKKRKKTPAYGPKRARGYVRQRRSFFLRDFMDNWRRRQAEQFRPDKQNTEFLKAFYVTKLQRLNLARWGLYALMVIFGIVLEDVIFTRITLFHARIDLPAVVILLLTVLEGSEVGSVFVLVASVFYYFSGSAPGAYCVGLLMVFGTLASLLRQKFWHRSSGSIVLCTGIALFFYEMGLLAAGMFLGLTTIRYAMRFVLTAVYSAAAVIPLYPLSYKIGQIGGNTWKE